MEYRSLGNTGLSVSAISLGCEGFMGQTEEQVRDGIDFAIDKGINFIDIYSSNPDLRSNIGKALTGRREQFIIQGHLCTAWEDGQYLRTRDVEKAKTSFNDQLIQLNTDYLDVGMIHYIDAEQDFQEVFNGPVIRLALQLKKEGRIRHLGVSSHNPVIARKIVETGLIDVLLFSINPCYDMQPASEDIEDLWADQNYAHALHNIDPDREKLYELCEQRGVGIDVMKVYGGGDLLSEINSPFGIAMTPVQCIEYALTRPGVAAVMIGCKNKEEIQAAVNWCSATKVEKDYASVMAGMEKFSWQGHCMYCGHCAPCSVGIDVASVNKYYNLTIAQNDIPETVREHYKVLTHHASECIACGQCETNCPFGVAIIEQMEKAAERFGY
ncbi:aldo/keto reductase [Parabacteroides sp. GYB001]|uniref:aldo/keto reductase n=1 Tax=Parabacteroides leei TaxID=2939491 RepID=UPI002016D004|nr:aldo/keto reductase [Parabacteroides leei]MCL3852232.1 aldo/keto reductase [Parabacteroides leei]